MSALKNVQIKTSYKIKHFIEQTSFCTIYTGIDLNSSKLVNLNIYKASKIARDDLGEDENLRELSFLKLGVEGFPKLLSFGEFTNDLEKSVISLQSL